MSKPEELLSTTLPAPTGGLDFYNPLAAMSQSNTPWMVNAEADNRLVKVRNAYRIFATLGYTPGGGNDYHLAAMATFGRGSSEVLYCMVIGTADTLIYKITPDATVTLDATVAAVCIAPLPFKFGANLAFFSYAPTTNSPFLNQSVGTWALWTLGYGGNALAPGGSLFYKGRIYGKIALTSALSSIAYGDVGQIQGAITNPAFAVGQIFATSGRVAWMGSFVISNDAQSTEYVAFGNELGEVLVYSGDSPAADNWTLIARLKTSSPIITGVLGAGGECTYAYENDTLIFTYSGVVSLKTLFANKDKANVEAAGFISLPVNNYWTALVAGIPTSPSSTFKDGQSITAAFHETDRTLYILVQGHIDVNGTLDLTASTMFLYNLNGISWSIHKITQQTGNRGLATGPCHVCYFQGDIYFWTEKYIMKLDPASWLDQQISGGQLNVGYDFAIHGAPTTFEDSVATKVVQGYEPIVRQKVSGGSPLRCGFGVKVSTDFGRKESGAASPTQTTEFAKRMYSVGAEGTFFQYKLEGNTATTSGTSNTSLGLDFYAINAFYKKGGVL